MSELQATLEFSVELNKFYNVDLFQRGYYQIRTSLKTPPKVPSKIEITLQKSQASTEKQLNKGLTGEDNEIPAHVINDCAVSRTFQILYRNEDVPINDVILYRFHTLVNSNQLEEELSKLEIQLNLELWFADEQDGSSSILAKAECASTRQLNIHINPTKGLHHHVPLLFDYFHLCCVEVTVHGTLIAIHQPFLSVPKLPKTAWSNRNPELSTLETVYFGDRPLSPDPQQCLPVSLHKAWQMHHRICNVLLSAYESLQATFEYYLNEVSGPQSKLEHIDCHQKLTRIMDNIRLIDNEEDLIQNGTRDITQLCAANVILWTQFLETATLNQGVIFHLAKDHHSNRVRRLADVFFTHEYPKNECLACYEPSYHGHSDLASMVRSSMYLQLLPPLDLECLELDGDYNSLPVIFEDVYYDQTSPADEKRSSRASSLSPNFVQKSTPVEMRNKPKRNFIKNIRPDTFKRPSSFNLKEAEAAAAKSRSHKDVMLVGYRKTTASPNVHSRVVVNSLELGTFSPKSGSSVTPQLPGAMSNSVSLPLLERTAWGRNSDGTLPEYMQVARRSLRAKKRQRNGGKTSIITVDFVGGSDPEISVDDLNTEDPDPPRRLQRALTDPVRHSAKGRNSIQNVSTNDGTPVSSNVNSSIRVDGGSVLVHGGNKPEGDSDVKKHLDFQQEMCQNLSHCLTQALGDQDLNDSDKSDDETCIQNGFVEFMDPGHGTEKPTANNCDGHKINESSKSENDLVNRQHNHGAEQSGLTVRDILKNNIMQLSAPGSNSAQSQSDRNSNSVNGNSRNGNSLVDVTSSDISLRESRDSRTSRNDPNNDSGITLSDSQTTLTSKDSSSNIQIISDRDMTADNESELTVIELLREEYIGATMGESMLDINQSMSDFSDSGVSVMSHRNSHKASSDSNILQSVESVQTMDSSLEVKKSHDVRVTSASFPDITKLDSNKEHPRLVSKVERSTVNFVTMRENLKSRMKYQGNLYSESPTLASQIPYFHVPDTTEDENQEGCHMIVCVHGLDGNSADLRLVKTYMEMALPGYRLEFLMSERNQTDTFADFDVMTKRLVDEIQHHIEMYSLKVAKLSFIGHSLGTIIIRSALTHPEMQPLLPKLWTFLSLSGPHLGTLYNTSGIVNAGMWLMQKWKKSGSLLQLSLKDGSEPRQSFLFKLSQKRGLEYFRHVLLVGSSQDRYVPYHSSRIEMCKAAQRESSGLGSVYGEMVANILTPIVNSPRCKLIRYDVFHALPSTANTIIGRAAHIAVLDSEIFIEKFLMVCGLKFFK